MPPLGRYRFCLPYLAPHLAGLLFVTAISIASTALSLVQPYLTKLLVDDALMQKNTQALALVAGLMVAVSVVAFALNVAAGYCYTKISARVLFAMRRDLLRHLHALSPRFYAEWKTGDVLSRLNNDISEIQRVVADALLSILGNVGFLVGSVVILVRMDLELFAVAVASLPVAVALAWWFRRMLVERVRELRERSAEIGSFLLNTLLGHRVVMAYGRGAREGEEFDRQNEGYLGALLRMQWISYLGSGMPGMVIALSTAVVFWVGGSAVIAGTMTIGTLMAFLAYHMRLLSPVQALMGLYTNLVTAQVSLERVEALFAIAPEVRESAVARVPAVLRGEVEIERVRFAYSEGRPVLQEVSWRVEAGRTGLVMGPSGRGKSTLGDLLLRFYDPVEGSVRLDGVDLREWRLADLRRHVCVVEQTPWLFPASVAENLRYGDEAATEEQMWQALEAVGLEGVFADLREKVGERGLALSAGQRQRLAIARALLRRPRVLVLDEPTAALDEASETLVTSGIRRALPEATLILITHRPRLRDLADTVLELV
jgi:ATP-binding cassette subfamily B protein